MTLTGVYGDITVGQLVGNIQYRLGDSGGIWSASEIHGYIQDGLDRFCLETGCLWSKRNLGDVAGQATYNLQSDTHRVERVTWDLYKIPPLNPEYLQFKYPAFNSVQGRVFGYLIGWDGPNVLRKVQIPSATDATKCSVEATRRHATISALSDDQMRIDEFAATPDADIDAGDRIRLATVGMGIPSGGSTFEIPDRYVVYIRHYVMHSCYEREGDGQNLKLAAHYRNRWEAGLAVCKGRLARAKTYHRTGVMGEPRPSTAGPPPRPQLPWNYGIIVRR